MPDSTAPLLEPSVMPYDSPSVLAVLTAAVAPPKMPATRMAPAVQLTSVQIIPMPCPLRIAVSPCVTTNVTTIRHREHCTPGPTTPPPLPRPLVGNESQSQRSELRLP